MQPTNGPLPVALSSDAAAVRHDGPSVRVPAALLLNPTLRLSAPPHPHGDSLTGLRLLFRSAKAGALSHKIVDERGRAGAGCVGCVGG
jgi:hypothetical protein